MSRSTSSRKKAAASRLAHSGANAKASAADNAAQEHANTAPAQKPERPSVRQRRLQRARQLRLRRLTQWLGALVAVAVAGLIVWGLLASRPEASTTTAALPDFYGLAGQTAQDFTLYDTTHQPIALSSLRGQRVLINFWYADCPGCKAEMPDFATFYQQNQGQHIVILGVNILDNIPTATHFMQQVGVTYPVVFDTQQQVFTSFHLTSTPSSIFVDSQGVIRGSVSGPLNKSQLQTYFAALH
jgi:peroxiredoxin